MGIFATCLFVFESSCFFHSEGTAVADHYREGDRGRLEFRRACLRLRPLLNERCSILLIMLLRLMSLSANSEESNRTLLLFWPFAFLIGLNKSVFLSSCHAIHIPGLEWHLFGWSFWPCIYVQTWGLFALCVDPLAFQLLCASASIAMVLLSPVIQYEVFICCQNSL